MQVIYHTHDGLYPFHPHTDSQTAFVEHLAIATTSQLYDHLREVSKIYKSISCDYLVRLHKILRDEQEIHFVYEYHNVSVEAYLKDRPMNEVKRVQTQAGCALRCLQQAGLKADIRIDNLGVDHKGSLKLFVTPDSLEISSKEELQEFYSTEKTRIRFELEEIWERTQISQDDPSTKLEKNPGFIISGNQLIFLKKDSNLRGNQGAHSNTSTSTPTPTPTTASTLIPTLEHPQKHSSKSHIAKNIISEIERQRELTQKFKNRRQYPKGEKDSESEPKTIEKHIFSTSKDEQHTGESKLKIVKRNSIDQTENFTRRQQHRNSTGGAIFIPNPKSDSLRLVSSATDTSKNNQTQSKMAEERPTSSLKTETRISYNTQGNPSAQDFKTIVSNHLEIEGTEQEPKFHITTQMVSKYKMKIVTCQEIQFEGKEGDDIEKLAQEKLLEYQNQHGYPQLLMETACEGDPEAEEKEEKLKPDECRDQNEQILAKIFKAKQKASSALKEYAKTKKK